jgi:hypothetical protein
MHARQLTLVALLALAGPAVAQKPPPQGAGAEIVKPGAAAPAPRPAIPPAAAAPATIPPAAAPSAALPVDGEAAFLARCHADYAARYPGARGAAESCREAWPRARAAVPAADSLLALAGTAPDLGTARAQVAGATWGPRPGRGDLATGRAGAWQVALRGRAAVDQVVFSWSRAGAMSPYDVVGALRLRGAEVTEVACERLGVGERSLRYRVEAPPRSPFGLVVYDREAPTANALSTYGVTLDLRAAAPGAPRGARPGGCD